MPVLCLGALIALASKPSTVLLALPLATHAWVGARRDGTDATAPHQPMSRAVWVSIVGVALAGLALVVFTVTHESPVARTSELSAFSMGRVLSAMGLQGTHVVVPTLLEPRYDPGVTGPLHVAIGAAIVAVAGSLLIRLGRARDPRLTWVVLALAAYVPVSNVVPLARYTADSYAYVPWLAVVATVALSWSSIAAALRPAPLIFAGACLAWAAATVVQVETWTDSRALWKGSFEAHPDDPEVIYRYGDALARAGEGDAALMLFITHETALEDGQRVPAQLPQHYVAIEAPERAVFWYRRAFASPVAQDSELYLGYVELVAGAAAVHDPGLDAALRHGLGLYLGTPRFAALDVAAQRRLTEQARRLGLGG